MKINYDSELDVLYMHFKDGVANKVIEVEDDIIVELDEKGNIMGIEVWNAFKRGLISEIEKAISIAKQS